MPEKIAILKESGETLNSNIVSFFMIPDTEKKYMITTENAVDPHGLTVLHVSELVDGNLQRVSTDEEWSTIKTIMRAIISGNVGTFQYLPAVENANASGQYSRDISVSSTAANQMITSYNNGEKNLASQQPVEEPIQPIQDIGTPQQPAMNANVVPVSSVAQPAAPGMAVNPGMNGVGIEPSGAGVSPIVTSDQVLSPGVNPVLPVNPVVNGMENPGMVGQEAPVGQTGAIPIVNNLMPDGNAVVDPMNGMAGMSTGVVVPGMEGVPSENPDGMINPSIPQGQIVQPTDVEDSVINPNVQGSFAPDASLDEVVVASQEMFMEGVKNLVQTIQEKVYRELYIKEEELKKREAELEQREQSMNNMMNPMQAFSSMMQMNPNLMNQMAQMAQMGGQMNPASPAPMEQTQGVAPVSLNSLEQNSMMNNPMMGGAPATPNPMMNGADAGSMASPMVNPMQSPMDANSMMSPMTSPMDTNTMMNPMMNTGMMQQPMIVQASNDNFNG